MELMVLIHIKKVNRLLIKKNKDVFFITYEGLLLKVTKNLKSLIESLKLDKNKTDLFIKKNNINITKEEDLVKFINYLNSLN